MKIMSILLLTCASMAVQAEVFRCTDKLGKTVYQSKPCQAAEKGRQLDIKTDPAKEAEGKAKMEALQSEYSSNRAARIEAEKQAAAQKYQADQVDALRQSAEAQQQQAAAEQRQADALEKQNQQNNRPVIVMPPPSAMPLQQVQPLGQ